VKGDRVSVLFVCFLTGVFGASAPVTATHFTDIPIYVEETWLVPYAANIQDISFDWISDELVIRSNGSRKVFLANPVNCDSIGEIDLPAGSDGFGIAINYAGSGEYYINSNTSGIILHSDGSDSWTGFANPAGTNGAGMDMYSNGPATLCEALDTIPCSFLCMEPDGSGSTAYRLPGVGGEISGFMGHQVATTYGDPPSAIIATTRFEHEFFFLHETGGSYYVYGQEPCPLPVSESLGLTWSPEGAVYWSYKGTDDSYYVSKLQIPVFGGIDDSTESLFGVSGALGILHNPSTGSAGLVVDLSAASPVTLKVFDTAGRLQQTLHNGMLTQGENSFSFAGTPGVYTAVLEYTGQQEKLRFVVAR
jgi:hypothetical protein